MGPKDARNVLVLVPGSSAGGAYFVPLAKTLVKQVKGWQVWSVERRENQLEDQSMLDEAKEGRATPQQLFDYYLGYLSNTSIATHFRLIPDANVAYAKQWGMRVEVEDLHRVVAAARKGGRHVVLGGHSLGGSITTAYATWDFHGRAGARDLSGLVYIDGGSSRKPVTTQQANRSLQSLKAGSPWLAFGGIGAPFAGLFNAVASTLTHVEPDAPAKLQAWPPLPASLRSPIPVTNVGGYGLSLDTATHGDDVKIPIYAFAAALGGTRVLDAARALAKQSHLPRRELTLVDRHTTYAHNDPAGAFPSNAFLSRLTGFLRTLRR